ncbi:MAG: pilus assembly protein FlpE, partial [Cellulomonadaceae bacterium]|nr:pilus assembly protein FlpE [Cellulomonadaceae bacterium]
MKKTRSLTAVIGAKGGIGASCLAAAIAHGAQQTEGRGALLDLDTAGGGLEVLLGIEGEPGARWPEMLAAFGEVDGGGLLAALPRWGAVPVLSAARQAPQLPPDELVLDICAGLLRNDETVV